MFLVVPAYSGSPGQRVIEQLCVCVYVCTPKHIECKTFCNIGLPNGEVKRDIININSHNSQYQ